MKKNVNNEVSEDIRSQSPFFFFFSFFASVRDALGWSHAMHYSKKAFIDYSADLTCWLKTAMLLAVIAFHLSYY